MKNLRQLNAYRYQVPGREYYGDDAGAFLIPHPATGVKLRVVAGSGEGWDHVSVSLPNRCPNWPEMCFIKELFFHDIETVMQLHVPSVDHVNNHPYCLHLWRPLGVEIPRPPAIMVGIKELGDVSKVPTAVLRAIQEASANREESA